MEMAGPRLRHGLFQRTAHRANGTETAFARSEVLQLMRMAQGLHGQEYYQQQGAKRIV
jgi:hypothetical protein